jgi:hypothetical protein
MYVLGQNSRIWSELMTSEPGPDGQENTGADSGLGRRDFVKGLGKFATLTPPAVTMLLHVSMSSPAVAGSGGKSGHGSGGKPGWGYGAKTPHTGPPGLNKKHKP